MSTSSSSVEESSSSSSSSENESNDKDNNSKDDNDKISGADNFSDRFAKTASGKVKWGTPANQKVPAWKQYAAEDNGDKKEEKIEEEKIEEEKEESSSLSKGNSHLEDRFAKTESGKVKWGTPSNQKAPSWKKKAQGSASNPTAPISNSNSSSSSVPAWKKKALAENSTTPEPASDTKTAQNESDDKENESSAKPAEANTNNSSARKWGKPASVPSWKQKSQTANSTPPSANAASATPVNSTPPSANAASATPANTDSNETSARSSDPPRSSGRVKVPPWLAGRDKKPATPSWVKKRNNIEQGNDNSTSNGDEKKEESSEAVTKQETSVGSKPPEKTVEKKEAMPVAAKKSEPESRVKTQRPPPPPMPAAMSPAPPPPGSAPTDSERSESELSVRTDDLDEEIVLETDEEEVALETDDEEEIAIETDDEEDVGAETDEEILVETDDEYEVFTDENDSQDGDDEALDVKQQISNLQAATPRDVPRNLKPNRGLATAQVASRTKPTSEVTQSRSLETPNSPASFATSQAVGNADTGETNRSQETEIWIPVSTKRLPILHSAARQVATNPQAFYETEYSDNDDLGTKEDTVSKSLSQDENISDSDLDTWMIPQRHDDDSSWVNPTREVDEPRKQKLLDGMEDNRLKGTKVPDMTGITGIKQFSDEKTVSTIGQRSVLGDELKARGFLGGISQLDAEDSIHDHRQITEHTWALPSRATQHRGYKDLLKDHKDDGKDYRFSYIAATHTHSTASYSDSIREKFFPNQDNPIWEPNARSQPVGLDSNLSSKPGGVSSPFDDEESWMPPDESELAAAAVVAPAAVESAPKPSLSVGTSKQDRAQKRGSRTKRIDFTGRITDDPGDSEVNTQKIAQDYGDSGGFSWVPGPQAKPEQDPSSVQQSEQKSVQQNVQVDTVESDDENPNDRTGGIQNVQSIAESRPPDRSRNAQPPAESRPPDRMRGKSRQQNVESQPQDEDDTGDMEDGFHAPKDIDAESRRYGEAKHAPQNSRGGINYDEEAPQTSRNASTPKPAEEYATSASGRVRFAIKPETIIIESNIDQKKGSKRRSRNGDMPSKDYVACVGCVLILVLLLVAGAGTAIYFLVFKDDVTSQEPPTVSNPGPGDGTTTLTPTLAPAANGFPSSPSMPAPTSTLPSAPVSKPIDDQNKPSSPNAPSPTQSPISNAEPTSDVLLALLSRVSLDNGAALRDPLSPQFAAMQWIRTPNNQGIYSDRVFLQRYALATVYYATGGEQWSSSDRWLTNSTECEWYSSSEEPICDSEGNLLELNLSDNNLLGIFPPEVTMLSNSLGEYDIIV
jgi:hypothetical protein